LYIEEQRAKTKEQRQKEQRQKEQRLTLFLAVSLPAT